MGPVRALLAGRSLRAPTDAEIARICDGSGPGIGAGDWRERFGIQRAECRASASAGIPKRKSACADYVGKGRKAGGRIGTGPEGFCCAESHLREDGDLRPVAKEREHVSARG